MSTCRFLFLFFFVSSFVFTLVRSFNFLSVCLSALLSSHEMTCYLLIGCRRSCELSLSRAGTGFLFLNLQTRGCLQVTHKNPWQRTKFSSWYTTWTETNWNDRNHQEELENNNSNNIIIISRVLSELQKYKLKMVDTLTFYHMQVETVEEQLRWLETKCMPFGNKPEKLIRIIEYSQKHVSFQILKTTIETIWQIKRFYVLKASTF